jgi:hypothetical protein
MTPAFPDPVNGPYPSSPEPDYPAAHSMDTHWYAVDAAGHVALFVTGENGHAPSAAGGEYLVNELARLSGQPDDDDNYRTEDEMAPDFGFFVYDYDEDYDPIGPYRRTGVPPTPAHIDQLPPDIRAGCRAIQFDFRFSDAALVQPLEKYECAYWYDERACYVAADGVTVRPIPGKEAEFADFVTQLRAERPDEAARYRFEGPTDGN